MSGMGERRLDFMFRYLRQRHTNKTGMSPVTVECRQEGERLDDYACKSSDRPDDEQPCYRGVDCP
ncbi:unnamed protein product, partial [Gongylonema pulchrum]|uniref:Transposase n=1 Tax=Gongylonema pulchrum TaxID=637853 RepID=A0A183DH28_9BILA